MTPLVQTPFLAQSFVFTSKTPPAHPPPEEQVSSTLPPNQRKSASQRIENSGGESAVF